jgi:hypothetical protein
MNSTLIIILIIIIVLLYFYFNKKENFRVSASSGARSGSRARSGSNSGSNASTVINFTDISQHCKDLLTSKVGKKKQKICAICKKPDGSYGDRNCAICKKNRFKNDSGIITCK